MEAALVGASAVVEGVGVAPGPLEARLEALAEEHPIERRKTWLQSLHRVALQSFLN